MTRRQQATANAAWPTTASIVVDAEGRVTGLDRDAATILGVAAERAVGQLLAELLPTPAWLGGDAAVGPVFLPDERSLDGQAWTVSLEPLDGPHMTALLVFTKLSTTHGPAYLCTVNDASAMHPSDHPDKPPRTLLETLFDRAPEIITVTDATGRQRTVNAAGLRILGFDPALTRPFDGLAYVHPDDRVSLEAYGKALEQRRGRCDPSDVPPSIRFRIRDGAGEWRWLETVVADLTDVPEVAGRVAFSRDVTESEERAQALTESQARLHALIASFPGGALLADASGRILSSNDALTTMLSESVPGLLPQADIESFLSALTSGVRHPERPRSSSAAETDPAHWELALRDGRLIDAEAIPIRSDGYDLGVMWSFRDATDRVVRAQEQQRMLSLERDARHAAEILTEQLRAYDTLRSDFVNSVSHGLRTPLASISSAAQLLLDRLGQGDATTQSYLEIIDRNAARLRHTIENLLLVSRLEASMLALNPGPMAVREMVEDVVALMSPMALERGVRLRIECGDDVVAADRQRISEVLDNLLSNAIKYSGPGTEVTVAASFEDDSWTLSVSDHGPGIPDAERQKVFERFVRAADADRDGSRGSGLGLAISKGLVELHGGAIGVERAGAMGGARFWCTLPREPVDGAT